MTDSDTEKSLAESIREIADRYEEEIRFHQRHTKTVAGWLFHVMQSCNLTEVTVPSGRVPDEFCLTVAPGEETTTIKLHKAVKVVPFPQP